MDWSIIEKAYLALSRVFDGFFNFLYNIFNGKDAE